MLIPEEATIIAQEIKADPLKKGYAQYLQGKDINTGGIADLLNEVIESDAAYLVARGTITIQRFTKDCQNLGIWSKLYGLSQAQPQAFAFWDFYLTKVLPHLEDFDISGSTFSPLLDQMIQSGLIDQKQAPQLTHRAGSRSEVLIQRGIDYIEVAQALGVEA